MPSIAIGVSYAHPRPKHLVNCLTSLLSQTHSARIVVCQDVTVGADVVKVANYGVETHPVTYDRTLGGNLPKVRNVLFDYDADIYCWIDGDCIVEQDFLARVEAILSERNRLCVFPRARVQLPTAIHYSEDGALMGLLMAPQPPRGINKSREFIEARLNSTVQQEQFEIVCGPCQACLSSDAELWDENFRDWGCDDQDWGYRMLKRGLQPVIGPTVYHQEHEMPAGWMSPEIHARNIRLLREKHALA